FGMHDVLDDMANEVRKECDLIDEVRKRLKSGECNTMQEALAAIRDMGTGDLKARAIANLEKAKAGTADRDGFKVSQGLDVRAQVKPNTDAADALLKQADAMAAKGTQRGAGVLYALVRAHSGDKSRQDKAKEAFEKLPEALRKQLGAETEKKG